jgi:hypothetical protein
MNDLPQTREESMSVIPLSSNIIYPPKPRIYLAGKIHKNDWRHPIVPGLRDTLIYTDEKDMMFDQDFVVDCRSFNYGGPFFVACDHGCFHGPNSHGVGILDNERGDDPIPADNIAARRAKIFDINKQRLTAADLVFAYIEDMTCYGTLVELGMAALNGKPVTIGLAPSLTLAERDDLWMAAQTATRVLIGSAADCWAEFEREHFNGYPFGWRGPA